VLPAWEIPTVFVWPGPEAGWVGDGNVVRLGKEAARKELERIRDFFRKGGWQHIAGGRFAPDDPEVLAGRAEAGAERKEHHIRGLFGGLTGGHFSDLTFTDGRGRILHVQSVDVDRNGRPTRRELDNAEKIRRMADGKEVYVLLIPKGAQLERNRRYRWHPK